MLVLMYYGLYLTQVLLRYLFDLGNSNVSRAVNRLRPLLLGELPLPVQETVLFAGNAPKPRRRIGTLDELFRPKDKAKRRVNCSGKKKRHTLKTQVITSRNGLLLHVSRSISGKVNDLTLLRGSVALRELPAALPVRFNAVEPDYPDRVVHIPHKARRNHPVDLIEKWANQLQNRYRLPIENALAHLRRFRLLADIYRGPARSCDDTFLAISGLHNFRKLGSLT